MQTLLTMLLIISVLTTLTTQAIKKVSNRQLAPNVLAAVVSCILSVAISIANIVYNVISVTPQVIIEIIALTYFSFLTATVGYDKVIQAIRQVIEGKVDAQALDGDK